MAHFGAAGVAGCLCVCHCPAPRRARCRRRALLAPLGVLRDAVHAGPNAEQAYAGRAELIQGVRHFADCRGSTVRRCCFAPPGN